MIDIQQYKYSITIPSGTPSFSGQPEDRFNTPRFAMNGLVYRMDVLLPSDNTITFQVSLIDENDQNVISLGSTNNNTTGGIIPVAVAGFHNVVAYNASSDTTTSDIEITVVLYIDE